MYESRTYDNEHAEPVVVLVTTGQHDVSRLVHFLNGAPITCEQLDVAQLVVRQLKQHNKGRAALELLKAHGGSDFTDQQSPTDPAGLGKWLRKLPHNTILRSEGGNAWQLHVGVEPGAGEDRQFPAVLATLGDFPFEITEGHPDLEPLAEVAPFTVLALGESTDADAS